MDQDLGSFNMLEEFEAHAEPLASTFDDTGNIRHHEAAVMNLYYTQVRVDRREVIVRDLRLRTGRHCQQRRLADIREAHQPHVCDQF